MLSDQYRLEPLEPDDPELESGLEDSGAVVDPELDEPELEESGAVVEPGLDESGELGLSVLPGLLGAGGLSVDGLLGPLGLVALGLVVLPESVLLLFTSDSLWWRWKMLFHQCALAVWGVPNKPSIAPARIIV